MSSLGAFPPDSLLVKMSLGARGVGRARDLGEIIRPIHCAQRQVHFSGESPRGARALDRFGAHVVVVVAPRELWPSLPPVPSHASCDGGSRNTPKGFRRWSTAIISVQHFGDPERSGKKGRLAADYFSTLCLCGPLPIPSHPIPFPRLLRGLFHRPALDRPSDAG